MGSQMATFARMAEEKQMPLLHFGSGLSIAVSFGVTLALQLAGDVSKNKTRFVSQVELFAVEATSAWPGSSCSLGGTPTLGTRNA